MLPYLLISPNFKKIKEKVVEILKEKKLALDHPNLLLFNEEAKLGVEQAKQIRQHLSAKPFQDKSQAVVLINAAELTSEAQNALLKSLEELPDDSLIILGARSEDQLLPTVVSRCQVVYLKDQSADPADDKFKTAVAQILKKGIEERFKYLEKLEEKEEFLLALTSFFRKQLLNLDKNPQQKEIVQQILDELIEAERWQAQNVNPRAILEYLMLKIPEQV